MAKKVWIKGELLDSLDSVSLDPRHHLARKPGRSLFERLDWFQRLMPSLPGRHPLVLRSWIDHQNCWMFFTRDEKRTATALANWYSFAWRPVFSEVLDEDVKLSLILASARRLRTSRAAPVDIQLAPVPRADGTSRLLIKAFTKAGWRALRHQSSTSWTACVTPGDFAGYWAARPGALRSTHDRKLKKYKVETRILTTFDADTWAAYEDIYSESWKPREGNAELLRSIARDEAAAGCLRLGIASIEGRAVAAQFWTAEDGVAYIHKLAHREDARESSAGTILSAALFRHVIDEDGVALIDFGTGNDRYKADWMDKAEPLDTVRFYDVTKPLGLYRYIRARISALVRKQRLD